jgi:hypothetical protein
MAKKTWVKKIPRKKAKPVAKISDTTKTQLDVAIDPVISQIRKRLLRRQKAAINKVEEVLARWYRNALYVVVTRRTPHGRAPTFETLHARIHFVGDGKFDLALPIRKGWAVFKTGMSAEEVGHLLQTTVII